MRILFLHLSLAAVFGFASASAWALNPSLPPGSNFDLSHWYLQLPTSNNILTGAAGSVDSASTAQLVSGFTNAYFYTGGDGAMVFWAPDNGATTGGSTHPRSELRELLNPNDSSVNWTVYGSNYLSATCVVSNVSSDTGKVCIGQIHEPNTKPDGSASANNELTMIMFDLPNQKIYANVNLDGNLSSSFSTTFISGSNVGLNKSIGYTMSVVNGVLKVSINNVTNSWNLFSGTNYLGHVATNWDITSSNTVYFKAGDYNQTDNTCGCTNDGARVAFYSLTTYHAPSITSQPTNWVGVAGGSAAFNLGAVGNGALSYQWWLNGSNSLAGATNASLVLSNLTGANLGNYSAVVSDSTPGFYAVTSSVVVLTGNFPPVITSQPIGQSTTAGSNTTFVVGENGTAPLTNHWWFNTNTSLSWATSSSLTITNTQSTNAGNYFVVINNKYGAVTSAVATLTINLPPAITNQPAGLTVNAGSNASFAVGVTGTPPLNYRWWFNATNNLAGTTNAFLNLTNVSGASSGNYTVVITNNFGSVTSAIATLSVVATITFTNAGSTNWICPDSITSVQIECWGAGGAGGSAQRTNAGNAFAGGGGGGSYARLNAYAVIPGTNYNINVGSGGLSSTNDLAAVGGGDSWFNIVSSPLTNILAKGGGGGVTIINIGTTGRSGTAGLATAGSIGDFVLAGGNGGAGITSPTNVSGGGGGGAGDSGAGGNASSITNTPGLGGTGVITVGGAGGTGVAGTGANGTNGIAPGGGGGGAKGSSANGVKTGGSGATGRVVLTYTVSGCLAATAAMPVGNGGGTGGLTICPSQSITLTETPSAGTAPFTYAWKKVGSGTILSTSNSLVVSSPANGDQYTCDVTSDCGNGTSTSPMATLTVASPVVALNVSAQSVYRTMSVNVTASLSGSATGGAWTSSGTGTFSSTNALTTIYTPAAADAGTTVTLIFTTTQPGGCTAATATDVVTFNQAANPDKVVIIKADDFRGELTYGQQWTNFLQVTRSLGVKVGIGVICTNIVGSNSNLIAQWMQSQEAVGDVEFWDHAWDHTQWTNAGGQVVSEYEGSGLAYMQQHLGQSQAALAKALDHDVIAFGTPYNGFDTNTAAVINAMPALRLFFTSSVPTARSYLNASVAAVKIISEADGTGLPNSTNFIATYPGGPAGPVALQFHPPYFDAPHLLEFQRIIQFLQTKGYSILLPSEYVATLPAITNQPVTQAVLTGSNATFIVGATGDPTLAYQWQFNGTNRAGATNPTLTLSNVQAASVGGYSVVITNASGSVTSAVASLAIKLPPAIAGALVANQTFQINYTGTPFASYLVQAKTNLSDPVWLPIGTNVTGSNGVYIFTDASFTNFHSRFYRLAAP